MTKIWQSPGREIVNAMIGRLAIIVTGRRRYDDDAWRQYLGVCKEMHYSTGTPPIAVLNYSPLVGPTATQRRLFSEELEVELRDFKRVAIVSDSAFVRGAIAATQRLTRNRQQIVAPYSPARIDEALAWLAAIANFDVAEAKALFLELVRVQGDDPMQLLRRRVDVVGPVTPAL